jgi:hypothetical protein
LTTIAVIDKGIPAPRRGFVKSYGIPIDLEASIKALVHPEDSFVVDGETAREAALHTGNRISIPVTTERMETHQVRFRIWKRKVK